MAEHSGSSYTTTWGGPRESSISMTVSSMGDTRSSINSSQYISSTNHVVNQENIAGKLPL